MVNITHINPINTNINKTSTCLWKLPWKVPTHLGMVYTTYFLWFGRWFMALFYGQLWILAAGIFRPFFSEPKIQAAKPPAATVQGSVEMFNGTAQADVVQHFLAGTAKIQQKHRENQGKIQGKPIFTCCGKHIIYIYTYMYIYTYIYCIYILYKYILLISSQSEKL